jgi:hypothetical protein
VSTVSNANQKIESVSEIKGGPQRGSGQVQVHADAMSIWDYCARMMS